MRAINVEQWILITYQKPGSLRWRTFWRGLATYRRRYRMVTTLKDLGYSVRVGS